VIRVLGLAAVIAGALGGWWWWEHQRQARLIAELSGRLDRLKAEDLVGDLAVTGQERGPDGAMVTHLSFVEYRPGTTDKLIAKTFTVRGEEVYVDALVVHFDDRFVEVGDGLRGRSLLLFRRAFGDQQKPSEGVPLWTSGGGREDPVPAGLEQGGAAAAFERDLWVRFWTLANDPEAAHRAGVRVAQGEAPHVVARPHQIYQLKLRAAGGLELKPRLSQALREEMEHKAARK
jgi:hypothetical protein